MSTPVQVRLSGSGGQGLITAGVILAEAAMLDGRNVVQTQTYGPEARLGSSKSEVIISAGSIAYPQVTVPDVLVCLSTEAAQKYMPQVHKETLVLIDSTSVSEAVTCNGSAVACKGRVLRLPISAAAAKVGSKVTANVVALAAVNELVGLVGADHLRAAILARVPAKFRDLNERAIEAGRQLAQTTAQPAK